MSNCRKILIGSGHVTFIKDWHCKAKIELSKFNIFLPKVELTSFVLKSGQSFRGFVFKFQADFSVTNKAP